MLEKVLLMKQEQVRSPEQILCKEIWKKVQGDRHVHIHYFNEANLERISYPRSPRYKK